MNRKVLMCVAAVICLVAVSCQRTPRLVILHTNDTHSHFEPLRSGKCGVIERAAFIDSIRTVYGEEKVLLLDAGDFSQGTSYFSELGGQLEPKILNEMKYDCVALGNHEFDNGIEALEQRLSMLDMTKMVSANIDLSQFSISEIVKPYTIIERGGFKIGIIGMESDLSTNVSATVSSRIPQLDNVETINKYSEILHSQEKCDMIILLSHLGYSADQNTFVDDFIYVNDLDGKSVPIITDGCWGEQIGVIKVW